MPTIRLTQLAADRLGKPATARCVHWNNLLPGFGLPVSASGARSSVAMYHVGGKAVLETLASFAKVPRVDDARQLARSSIEAAAAGNTSGARPRWGPLGRRALIVRAPRHRKPATRWLRGDRAA